MRAGRPIGSADVSARAKLRSESCFNWFPISPIFGYILTYECACKSANSTRSSPIWLFVLDIVTLFWYTQGRLAKCALPRTLRRRTEAAAVLRAPPP